MKCTQIVPDDTGDTRHTFDNTDDAAVKEAMERFDDLIGKGYRAAADLGGGTQTMLDGFTLDSETTVFILPLVSG